MEIAAKILIVGGVLNLAYGFLTGIFLGKERSSKPTAPKYLVFAHVGPLMQGPALLGLVFAVNLSPLSPGIETIAAWLLVASSAFLAAKDTLNWVLGVKDEFQNRPTLGFILGTISALLAIPGLVILIVGVFRGF